MRPQKRTAWAMAALASLLLVAPGCVIRRGFVVQLDWSLTAHRTGCRHQWFQGRCRGCNALPCDAAPCEALACDAAPCGASDDSLNGAIETAPTDCGVCAPRCRRGLRHRFGGFWQSAEEAPPPAPEPPGPSNFHPLPTRPVYGNRSEQPDAVEAPMERLAPAPIESSMPDDEAPDEAPQESEVAPPADADDAPSGEESAMRSANSRGGVRKAAWQQSGSRKQSKPPKQATKQTLRVPECKSCTVRFK